MGRRDLSFVALRLGFGVFLALVASGCGSDADIHQAGKPTRGQCPIGIASTQDANNHVNMLDNGAMSADYSGPDGEGSFTGVCVHLGDRMQAFEVSLSGKKPEVGTTYDIGMDDKATAILRYAEDNDGSLVWIGNEGTVKITTAEKDKVGFSFDSVQLVPDTSKPNNTATGELTATGSATASDVLGFQP
jgi:hypothetical protein